MPLRLTALPPGAFIREHLVLVGGVDYVQAIYASYKAHLRRAGVKPVASRQAMSVYIYKANKIGLIAFDHAERIGDGLLPDYVRESRPQAPSPRHYYRIVKPEDPRWENLDISYREFRGLAKPVRKPPVKPPVEPVPPPPVKAALPIPRRRGRPAKPRVEVPPPPIVAPPAPPKKKRPAPRPKRPPLDVLVYEQRYEDIRRLAKSLAAKPTTEAMQNFLERVNGLMLEINNVMPQARGATAERLGEIQRRLTNAVEDIEVLRASLEILARETMPRRIESARRGVKNTAEVLEMNLVALRPMKESRAPEVTEDFLWELQGLLDEEEKTETLRRLERKLVKLTPEQRQAFEGLNELEAAIRAYHAIEPKGMSPQDYQDEKASAWRDIEEALEALTLVE